MTILAREPKAALRALKIAGRQGVVLAAVASVAGVARLSRYTGQNFAGLLVVIGFGGLTLLLGTLFVVAGLH